MDPIRVTYSAISGLPEGSISQSICQFQLLQITGNGDGRSDTGYQFSLPSGGGYQHRQLQDEGPVRAEGGAMSSFPQAPLWFELKFIVQKGREQQDRKSANPPLVLIHGSFHAAWCWAEHWLPFFSHHGFDCYALSLLGQGESDSSADSSVSGTLQTHAADVADFIVKEIQLPPVLLGHSFGGLIVQYYLANVGNGNLLDKENSYPYLAGSVLVCSVPPSGNSGLVWRYLFTKPVAAFKVTRSLAAKAFQTSLPLCRETFFSAGMEDHMVLRYQKLMKESSRMPLFDLRKLNASLPVPPMKDTSIKILVVGANDDFIVDAEGLSETGRFYGVTPVCVDGVAHDMMLDCSWGNGAQVILSWLGAFSRDRVE